jgi:acyl phosphate:glycerol-3-phosphate acyltransferase
LSTVNYIDIVLIFAAYLIGSIPTAVWVGKIFYKIDVREHGSGNAGATNTFRVLGYKAGIPVLVVDIVKGIAAASLVTYTPILAHTNPYINYQIVFGLSALLGHIFPIFAGFRGGKGVATILGVVIGIHLASAAIAIGIFVLFLLVFRYVSLASMMAGLSFPIIIMTLFPNSPHSLTVFSVVVALLLIITHKKNIDRLLKKQESKVLLFQKKSSK